MRHRLVGMSARGLLAVLLSFSTSWAQSVSTAQNQRDRQGPERRQACPASRSR